MRVGSCPNCGADVEFRSAGAAETICPFCRSILLARDASLERIGLAADPPASASPIQIGSGGVWGEKSFTVVGRVVYQTDAGACNDWHIVFDDGSSAWIPDARRLYAVIFPTHPPEPLVVTPNPGEQRAFHWNDTHYYVTSVCPAHTLGREGEVPCGSADTPEVVRATLLTADGRTGLILYGGSAPQLFLGDSAEFDDLHFTNLRPPKALAAHPEPAQALNCPSCGGALTLRTGGLALSLSCPHCLSLFDATHPQFAVLRKFEEARRIRPLLPLGSRGSISGEEFEVVGFQARTTAVSMGAILYEWHEYVLFHPQRGFRFLTEANGHWSETRSLRAHPDAVAGARPAVIARREIYRHFSTADAETIFVQGEFPWRLQVDEAARVTHYIHPPFLLFSDSSRRETGWFLGEYRTGRQIWDVFHLEGNPPPAIGVGDNEPRPAADLIRVWTFGVLLFLIVLVGGLACDTFLVTLPRLFWLASFFTLLPAVVKSLRVAIFERERWQRSDYNPKNARYCEVAAEPYMVSPYPHEPR